MHFGIMSGLLTASAKDTTPGVTVFAPGGGTTQQHIRPGRFTADFQVPFLGLYSVFTQGISLPMFRLAGTGTRAGPSSPGNNYAGLVNNAQGVSMAGGVYYRLLLQNWFVEPSMGGVWSRVQVDPLTTPLALGKSRKAVHCASRKLRAFWVEPVFGLGST